MTPSTARGPPSTRGIAGTRRRTSSPKSGYMWPTLSVTGYEVPVRDFGDQSPGGVHGEAGVGGGLGQGVQLDEFRGSGDRQREGRAREEGRRGLVERDDPGLRMGERLRFPVGARLRDSRSRGRSHGSRRVALHLHLLRSSVALQQEECQAAGMNIIRVKMVGSVFFFFFFPNKSSDPYQNYLRE